MEATTGEESTLLATAAAGVAGEATPCAPAGAGPRWWQTWRYRVALTAAVGEGIVYGQRIAVPHAARPRIARKLSLRTTARPLCTRYTDVLGTPRSEPAMRAGPHRCRWHWCGCRPSWGGTRRRRAW
jgi:hypothetical protein